MQQPDDHLLSEQIDGLRALFVTDRAEGETFSAETLMMVDALLITFVVQARTLEALARASAEPPIADLIADIDAERAATQAMADALARTKLRLRDMRALQDAPPPNLVVFAEAKARVLAERRGAAFQRAGDVSTEDALSILAHAHAGQLGGPLTLDGDTLSFGGERYRVIPIGQPAWDSPEDCA